MAGTPAALAPCPPVPPVSPAIPTRRVPASLPSPSLRRSEVRARIPARNRTAARQRWPPRAYRSSFSSTRDGYVETPWLERGHAASRPTRGPSGSISSVSGAGSTPRRKATRPSSSRARTVPRPIHRCRNGTRERPPPAALNSVRTRLDSLVCSRSRKAADHMTAPRPERLQPAASDSGVPSRWSSVRPSVPASSGRRPGSRARLPGPLPLLLVWVIGGVFALCGALTLSEVSSAIPETGGLYAFLRDGWGRLYGFLFGWAQLFIIRAASLGAISITFAEYLLRVLGHDPTGCALRRVLAPDRGGGHRHHGDVQHRRRDVGSARHQPHHPGQVWRPALHHRPGPDPGPAADRRPLHADGATGKLLDRAVRPGPGGRALGLRWLGRPELRRRRDQGPAAEPAAGAHRRHAGGDRDLPSRERRLPVGARRQRDPGIASWWRRTWPSG